jgi:hypothetical protein
MVTSDWSCSGLSESSAASQTLGGTPRLICPARILYVFGNAEFVMMAKRPIKVRGNTSNDRLSHGLPWLGITRAVADLAVFLMSGRMPAAAIAHVTKKKGMTKAM